MADYKSARTGSRSMWRYAVLFWRYPRPIGKPASQKDTYTHLGRRFVSLDISLRAIFVEKYR